MNRIEMVKKLVKEGFTEKTLANFSDKQITILSKRILGEATQVSMNKLDMNKTADKGLLQGMLKDPVKNAEQLKRTTFENKNVGQKTPTKKQIDALDKNKNGKIDKEDFKILRSKKKSSKEEVKEGDKKWIQKAIDTSKKGSLKKALGVKKDETIPAGKLKAAAKKGGKLGKRARLAMTLKKLNEYFETQEWVDKLVENNYHPVTTKNEIMDLIKLKLHEQPGIAEPEVVPDVEPAEPGNPDRDPFIDPFDPSPTTDPNPKMGEESSDLPEFLRLKNLLNI